MPEKIARRPIGNFFIKRTLQFRIIQKIVFAGVTSTIISSSALLLVYYLRYKTIVVYQLDRYTQELSRENIMFIILPALLLSALVSVILSFCIGLYSSRKYAVPIYKLEQWVSLLLAGKINTTLQFREKEEMRELTDKCNKLGNELHDTFLEIRNKVSALKSGNNTTEMILDIEKILSKMDFETAPEVNTKFYKISSGNEP